MMRCLVLVAVDLLGRTIHWCCNCCYILSVCSQSWCSEGSWLIQEQCLIQRLLLLSLNLFFFFFFMYQCLLLCFNKICHLAWNCRYLGLISSSFFSSCIHRWPCFYFYFSFFPFLFFNFIPMLYFKFLLVRNQGIA